MSTFSLLEVPCWVGEGGFLSLGSTYNAIYRHNLVRDIELSLIEYFLEILANGRLMLRSGHSSPLNYLRSERINETLACQAV